MSELFDAQMGEGKSPRLKWLEKHGLKTHDYGAAFVSPETGHEFGRWTCYLESDYYTFSKWANGETEADAIADWARLNGVRLWNEE
jgi:hypothetical protein